MNTSPSPRLISFVIRFVVDDTLQPAGYRGSIRHVQSGEEAPFTRWQQAEAFVRRFVPLEGGERTPKEGV